MRRPSTDRRITAVLKADIEIYIGDGSDLLCLIESRIVSLMALTRVFIV